MHVFVTLLLTSMFFVSPALAQPSTLPPSSLPVNPLSPTTTDTLREASCDLCRPLEGHRGSDLPRHHRPRDPQLHPSKKAPGVNRSLKHTFRSQLPHYKLGEHQEGPER
jgi:hypothetical protein